MLLAVTRHFLEFVAQRQLTERRMNEGEVPAGLVVRPGIMNDTIADGFEHRARQAERKLCVIQGIGPSVLIERRKNLPGLTEDASDSIVLDRLRVGEMVEQKAHGPLAWSIGTFELTVAE